MLRMLKRIDRIVLRVPGLSAAVAYYRDVLGLTLRHSGARLASFRLADESELVLHADPDLPAEAVYWLVEDVRDLYRRRAELRLTFTSAPQQVARGYKGTIRDPFGTVLLLIDRTTDPTTTTSGAKAPIEDARAAGAGALFAGIEPKVRVKRELLIKLYEQIGRTADDLPYTPHFESIYKDYIAEQPDPKPTRQEVWRHLLNLRKGGKLPRLGEARSQPPEIDADAKQRLRDALGEDIGRRDRLPYTPRFDALVDAFNASYARPLSPHLVWRLVATLAK